jgi:hypothetical protein
MYRVGPLMDAKFNLLGYRRHHSICYIRLFTTPLVVTTISGYNEFWPSDVLSRSGSWISSSSECWLSFISVCPQCWQLTRLTLQVNVKVTLRLTVSQSVSLGIEPHLGPMTRYLFLTVTFLFPWGALSDERTGLSFVCAAGPCQRSRSWVLVPWDLRPYFTVSDLRLPFSSPPTNRRVTVEVFDPASTRVRLTLINWLLLKSSLCVRNKRHLVARFTFSVLALPWIPIIWLRRRRVFIFT